MDRCKGEIGTLQLAILWSFIYTRLYTYSHYRATNEHKNHFGVDDEDDDWNDYLFVIDDDNKKGKRVDEWEQDQS